MLNNIPFFKSLTILVLNICFSLITSSVLIAPYVEFQNIEDLSQFFLVIQYDEQLGDFYKKICKDRNISYIGLSMKLNHRVKEKGCIIGSAIETYPYFQSPAVFWLMQLQKCIHLLQSQCVVLDVSLLCKKITHDLSQQCHQLYQTIKLTLH